MPSSQNPFSSALTTLVLAFGVVAPYPPATAAEGLGGLTLSSPQFADQGAIPRVYTCEGKDTSPALAWSGVPATAKSLVLIVEDPDVPDPAHPVRTWIHWLLYNLPETSQGLAEHAGKAPKALPQGTQGGLNDWKRHDYGGPCPPIGRHRYIHTLYALDVVLPILKSPTKAHIEAAMAGHILEQAQLIGTYEKEGKR
jgi:hypothetical protein